MINTIRMIVVSLAFYALSLPANAATLCVYDPAGKSGDYYRILNDFALQSASWGVTFKKVKPYTDEATAVRDYQAKQCDVVVATGVRLQRFNNFSTTIEAIGGLSNYALLEKMLKAVLTSPRIASDLRAGDHETIGIVPIGAAYLFVRDRSINSAKALAGKRIATLSYDKPSLVMVKKVGAIKVDADLGSIGPKFNNGAVDACYASAPAYEPFELFRGLGSKGGILKLPLAQATMQVVAHANKLPDGYAVKARKFFAGKYSDAMRIVKKAEARIPAKYWINVSAENMKGYDKLFQKTRIQLRDKEKAYHPRMLRAMRVTRCSADKTRAECVEKKE